MVEKFELCDERVTLELEHDPTFNQVTVRLINPNYICFAKGEGTPQDEWMGDSRFVPTPGVVTLVGKRALPGLRKALERMEQLMGVRPNTIEAREKEEDYLGITIE